MAAVMNSPVAEPGMDMEQAQADRHGFTIGAEMPTGKGRLAAVGEGAGPEVGNPYDVDPLGEEYHGVSYPGGKK